MTPPRYVFGVSGRTAEALLAQADTLANYLESSVRDRRAAFATTVTLPAVAKTLLLHREALEHRLAFVVSTLADAVEQLRYFAEHSDNGIWLRGRGIYASRAEANQFGDVLDADREYLRQLVAAGHLDRLAALWSVGFPVDWSAVHPELTEELPVYLPPTRSSRQRFWPQHTVQTGVSSPQEPSAPTGAPVVRAEESVVPQSIRTKSTPERAPDVALVPEGVVELDTDPLRAQLADLPSTLRRRQLRTQLQRWIGEALAYSDGELPPVDRGFFDLGMTSIQLEQVRTRITATVGFEPGETTAFDYPTITEFADYLERSLANAAAAPIQVPVVSPDDANVLTTLDATAIEQLSPVELERVLTAIL
ncbi:acyl carrier protein [Nocardia altamirensis]|uniref:acyl carrier protein n=1 Tax=Nocardia altamirensis TaxID=472158 RepID=UPI0008408245|nr:acyl carrier protein [Nocardia altamirensis]